MIIEKLSEESYGTWYGRDEELRAVGVSAGVGHREQTRLCVLLVEVLVSELLSVDGLATSSVLSSD